MRLVLSVLFVAALAGCNPASCDVDVQGEITPPAPAQPGPNAVRCDLTRGGERKTDAPVSGLDTVQIEEAIAPLLNDLARCVSDQDSGKLALRVTAAHEGVPRYVEPIDRHAKTALGSCAARTLCEMSLPPLEREISFGYNFEVGDLQQLKAELGSE